MKYKIKIGHLGREGKWVRWGEGKPPTPLNPGYATTLGYSGPTPPETPATITHAHKATYLGHT